MPAKAKFTPKQKAAVLKKTAKLSLKEAGAELGVSPQTVYKWRAEAKKYIPVLEREYETKVLGMVKLGRNSKKDITKAVKAIKAIQASIELLSGYISKCA